MKFKPWRVPLEDWPDAWLRLEISNLKRNPLYLTMTDDEKRAKHFPVTPDQMREYIRKRLAK